MHDGADQEPSGSRAMTSPEPALPEKTNPAFKTENTASPIHREEIVSLHRRLFEQSDLPLARCNTAFGMELSADSG